MTLASRITGFIRDTLLAILFGAGLAMDAFVVAFRLPNLLRRLFAEGAFSQAFVPVLGEYRTRKGDEATRELAGKVLAMLGTVLFLATVIGVVAAPLVVYAMASGFAADAVLRRYERRRRSDSAVAAYAFDAIQRIFGSDSRPLAALRGFGLDVVNTIAPLKRFFSGRAAGR